MACQQFLWHYDSSTDTLQQLRIILLLWAIWKFLDTVRGGTDSSNRLPQVLQINQNNYIIYIKFLEELTMAALLQMPKVCGVPIQSKEQGYSWEVNCCLPTPEIANIFLYFAVFTRPHHCSMFWAKLTQSTFYHPLRHVFILSYQLCLCILSRLLF
jgi:hypothetical protein